MRRTGALFASSSLTLCLAGCGATPAPTVTQVEVPPVVATPPETRFRGSFTLDWVGRGTDVAQIAQALEAKKKDVLTCLRSAKATPMEVWMVGRASSGALSNLKADSQASPEASRCLSAMLAATPLPGADGALSIFFQAEPVEHQATPATTESATATESAIAARDAETKRKLIQALAREAAIKGLSAVPLGPTTTANAPPWEEDPSMNVFNDAGGGKADGIGLGTFGTLGHGSHRAVPPSIRMGQVTVGPKYPPEVVKRVVRAHFASFRLCYENGLKSNPTLGGTVRLSFTINADGSVKGTSTGGSTLADAEVIKCVDNAFAQLSFPAPEGGSLQVSYPLHFVPPEGPPPAPVLTVGGVGFPSLDAAKVASVLEAKGWKTMAVEGPSRGTPFVVFAVKNGTPIHPATDQQSSLASIEWTRVEAHSEYTSEGVTLLPGGSSGGQAISDLLGR